MHVNHLEFSNSEAEDNFEIMRVCMGKRNLDQSCVLYEVTQQQDNLYSVSLYGEEEFSAKLCLYGLSHSWTN